jgi:hypothetical protein
MPYEEIDEATYERLLKDFTQPDFRKSEAQEAYPEKFCDTDACTIDTPEPSKKTE